MIGYYDPDTLTMKERGAVIQFIDASDMDNVLDVEINTASEARTILSNLACQRDRGISAHGGEARLATGPLTLNRDRKDEGVMLVNGDSAQPLPVKLDFEQAEGSEVPERSLMGGVGYMHDGAFIVERAAVYPLSPIPKNATSLNQPG